MRSSTTAPGRARRPRHGAPAGRVRRARRDGGHGPVGEGDVHRRDQRLDTGGHVDGEVTQVGPGRPPAGAGQSEPGRRRVAGAHDRTGHTRRRDPVGPEPVDPGVVEEQVETGLGEREARAGGHRPAGRGEPVHGQAERLGRAGRAGQAQPGLEDGQAAVGAGVVVHRPEAVQQHRVPGAAAGGGERGHLGVRARADQQRQRHPARVEGVAALDRRGEGGTGAEPGERDQEVHSPHQAPRM